MNTIDVRFIHQFTDAQVYFGNITAFDCVYQSIASNITDRGIHFIDLTVPANENHSILIYTDLHDRARD